MSINPYFDPDEIKLDKPILRNIMNAVIKRWKSGKKPPRIAIKALEAFRVSLHFYSDEQVNAIFKSIIICTNEMQMINAMARLKKEQPTTKVLSDMVIRKLENGELFKDD